MKYRICLTCDEQQKEIELFHRSKHSGIDNLTVGTRNERMKQNYFAGGNATTIPEVC